MAKSRQIDIENGLLAISSRVIVQLTRYLVVVSECRKAVRTLL